MNVAQKHFLSPPQSAHLDANSTRAFVIVVRDAAHLHGTGRNNPELGLSPVEIHDAFVAFIFTRAPRVVIEVVDVAAASRAGLRIVEVEKNM